MPRMWPRIQREGLRKYLLTSLERRMKEREILIMKPKTCIYCQAKTGKGREHCLPLGLGSFKGHHILRNLICRECNEPISKAEEQFLRVGPEGLIRQVLGITGRKHHKKISPFYRGSSGAPPIEIKHPIPKTQTDVLWEILPGTKSLNPIRQIGVSTEDGKVIQIPIHKEVSSKTDLLGILEKHGLEKAKLIPIEIIVLLNIICSRANVQKKSFQVFVGPAAFRSLTLVVLFKMYAAVKDIEIENSFVRKPNLIIGI